MTDAGPLLQEGRQVLAAVEALVKRSEDRAAYRRQHDRDLSAAHKAQLAALSEKLDALRDRVRALLGPGPDPRVLHDEFERLQEQLGELEGKR